MKLLTDKNFLLGAGAAILLLKFGDRLPVIGPVVAKLK